MSTDTIPTDPPTVERARLWARDVFAKVWVNRLVALWIFSGGFVLIEPAPYELIFLVLLALAMVSGMPLYRATAPIFGLFLAFLPFAYISAFQLQHLPISKGLLFATVTVFLWLTAYFVANFVAVAPFERMRLIMRAYLAIAVLVASIGLLAYLGVLPGQEIFLKFGRVKATFEDPNVFGPFLVLPAAFALQQALLWRGAKAGMAALFNVILVVGVFVSFSRGAWAHLILTSALVFILAFFLETRPLDKVRMIIIALIGGMFLIGALGALLSIPSVADLFLTRANLLQNYDSGSTGRFGRIAYGLGLALNNPAGIGPLEFEHLRITEQPHNTYLTVFLGYGWGGGLAYIAFVAMTIWTGLKTLVRRSPNRLLMIPLVATFIPLALESAIIDTDHWRHFFLIAGLIWGVAVGYRSLSPEQAAGKRPTIL